MNVLDECWEWNGSTDRNGYGQKTIKYKRHYTHRLAWAWANWPIPAGMSVLHRCDNPPCCNPQHLFLGTQADNIADMLSKKPHYHTVKKRCPSGHLYSGKNLRTANNGRHRMCKKCHDTNGKERYHVNKTAINIKRRARYAERRALGEI